MGILIGWDIVNELSDLLRPSWGAEQWILEGWNQINQEEKQVIKNRMDELFKDGLPFKLKSDKLLYIYTFSLLAQLEVLAIQVPLKFQSKMSTKEYQLRMRHQLLDEIFHGLVFTRILYMLCAPHALPPPYSPNIEVICNFIREESCPKVAIMLLNLIGEGWIEEIFYSLERYGIAPKVFRTILEDEHRHVCEADLYRDIGMPDIDEIKPKIAYLEDQLITNVLMQYKYMVSVCLLLGAEGAAHFKHNLDKKHYQQLSKLNLSPSESWQFFEQFGDDLLLKFQEMSAKNHRVELTPIRKVFMTQWDNPSDPTMVAHFNLNVSCIDFFNKKFPPETITTLMLQAISLGLSETDEFRNYLSFRAMYQCDNSYVGLVVKLPECGDHIGTIVFENCHLLTLRALSLKIRSIVPVMVYCYKQRELLEKKHPHLVRIMEDEMDSFAYDSYEYPMPGTPFVSVTNIGFCGYSQCKSPLRRNESMKYSLMELERKLVWDKATQSFEPQDILPISVSADHRVFDGNRLVPKIITDCFERVFAKMLKDETAKVETLLPERDIAKLLNTMVDKNLEVGYKALVAMQTYWFDFLALDDYFSPERKKEFLSEAYKVGTADTQSV